MSDSDIRNRIATVVLLKQDNPHEAADRILALIAEAMLSEDVVEAGAGGIYSQDDPPLRNTSWENYVSEYDGRTDYYAAPHILYLKECRNQSRAGITAALQAAGITPGDATIHDYVNISIDPGLPNGTIAFTNHDGETEYVKIATGDAREGGENG